MAKPIPGARLEAPQCPTPTERFSGRVGSYKVGRPHYPPEIIDVLRQRTGLLPEHVIADIGCGTGISSDLFLANGNRVFGIEPNPDMREGAAESAERYSGYTLLDGSAEATSLPDASVDYIVAGQAFHWFDRRRAHSEFKRILKPRGWVVLFWNVRLNKGAFSHEYEALIDRFALDYRGTAGGIPKGPGVLGEFFGAAPAELIMPNQQVLSAEGFRQRFFSCSYIPAVDSPLEPEITAEVDRLFDLYQQEGKLTINYETRLYWGRLTA